MKVNSSNSRVAPSVMPSYLVEDQDLEKSALDGVNNAAINVTRNVMMINSLTGGLGQGLGVSMHGPASSARRAWSSRPCTGTGPTLNDDVDLEDGEVEKVIEKTVREHGFIKARNHAVLSGIAYCLSSCSMILLNKVVLSGFSFDAGISLMFYQNLLSVAIVCILSSFGIISTEPLTWDLVRAWIPINIIFVGMLVTSIYSLKYINIAMVTILKNVTNIITALGDTYIFKKHQNAKVWFALFLMIISAISGGVTDISFHPVGYTWQILNCFLTASYSLTMRQTMDVAKQLTKSGNLNEFSMVLLNNSLSLPLGVLLIIVFNEWEYIYTSPIVKIPMFWVVATLSGLLGLAISFTSMWFLHQTSPTTYSLVGSLNKIPLSLVGILLFNAPISIPNFFSIIFGLFAGVCFAKAKMS